MATIPHQGPTIGFLSTWSVYEGTTIDSYTRTLLRGVSEAAREHGCNLLLGCGISLPGSPRASRTVWSVPGSGVDFVPVGPWNSDGLIVIPDDLSDAQFDYLQDLIRSHYPVVFTTAEKPGPLVAVDNAGGIRQAFEHLYAHGHRRIGFIAGKLGRGGDSAERLAAYRSAMLEAGLEIDERLIAYGEHRREDGRVAMEKILSSKIPFTALIASNDLSALGAIDTLHSSGMKIPEDVALIGFDDIAAARSQLPPLTTVRHPTFTLGHQAVDTILNAINSHSMSDYSTRVETKLVIRQSCGCRPESVLVPNMAPIMAGDIASIKSEMASLMADVASVEVRQSPRTEIEKITMDLVDQLLVSVNTHGPEEFDLALHRLAAWLDTHGEDAYTWHAALTTLHQGLANLIRDGSDQSFADELIDRSHLAVADMMQRQATEDLLQQMEISNRLGLMTSQLLASPDGSDSANILAQHLPQLGIRSAVVARYVADADDPLSRAVIVLEVGFLHKGLGKEFATREFPPADIYPDLQPYQFAILPLVIEGHSQGFVALETGNLEPCAAVVHNLTSALRTGQLYRDALEGRQLAEDANRLKSRFLSMVSHELRTPLSLIVGLSEMVLRQQEFSSGSSIQHDVEQINTSAQHLARLIGDVLDMASSEAGQLRILREPLDLADVLRVAANIGEELARDKGLEWFAQLPVQGPWILGDRTRLRQVTLNLISNAIKFTQQGKVELKLLVAEQNAVVSISDTGVGIPPSEKKSIFQEFHRSERTVESGYSGLGLGLAISKELVEQHGGSIDLISPGDFGCGSTFYFTLPVISTTEPQVGIGRPGGVQDRGILILGEGADAIEELRTYLYDQGFDVRATHVDKEIDWLAGVLSMPPQAVILGERLAAREGWAIAGMLKRQPQTAQIPVLAYSLKADQDQGELLELNYLQKPLRPEELTKELTRRLAKASESRTVLIVDDDPGILDLNSRMVEKLGCRSVTARNGREALEILDKQTPDLILLDLMMPEMDGFTFLDRIRANGDFREIPVVILTARVLSENDLERCNQGVTTILSKGVFSTSETLSHIESALNRQHILGRATQRLVRQALAYIHNNYADPLSREDIALQVGISPDYLTDCFRQEMGITPNLYIRRYRIRQARELLEKTDESITHIALAVGFSDGAHFTRQFEREVGMTPRAYRREKQV